MDCLQNLLSRYSHSIYLGGSTLALALLSLLLLEEEGVYYSGALAGSMACPFLGCLYKECTADSNSPEVSVTYPPLEDTTESVTVSVLQQPIFIGNPVRQINQSSTAASYPA